MPMFMDYLWQDHKSYLVPRLEKLSILQVSMYGSESKDVTIRMEIDEFIKCDVGAYNLNSINVFIMGTGFFSWE